jgi:hypothetical protein
MSHTIAFDDYTFPQTALTYNNNFGDAMPTTVKLAGMDGVWSEEGDEPAPRASGRVTISFTVDFETALRRHGYTSITDANIEDAMRLELDAIKKLHSKGLQRLTITSGTQAARYCYAKVNNIPETNKPVEGNVFIPIQVVFHVPNPIWLSGDYAGLKYGSGAGKYGAGLKYGAGALAVALSGLTTTTTITNNGNAIAVCKVVVATVAGQTALNPKVQRLKNGQAVDEISYTGTLTNGDAIKWDGRRHSIRLNGVDAWANASYQHPDMLRLEPGDNAIKVIMGGGGNAGTLRVWFNDTYI